jgi:hypothetical protein
MMHSSSRLPWMDPGHTPTMSSWYTRNRHVLWGFDDGTVVGAIVVDVVVSVVVATKVSFLDPHNKCCWMTGRVAKVSAVLSFEPHSSGKPPTMIHYYNIFCSGYDASCVCAFLLLCVLAQVSSLLVRAAAVVLAAVPLPRNPSELLRRLEDAESKMSRGPASRARKRTFSSNNANAQLKVNLKCVC